MAAFSLKWPSAARPARFTTPYDAAAGTTGIYAPTGTDISAGAAGSLQSPSPSSAVPTAPPPGGPMRRRYLFGPVSAAFADQNLRRERDDRWCLAFNADGDADLTVRPGDAWLDVAGRLPAGATSASRPPPRWVVGGPGLPSRLSRPATSVWGGARAAG